MTRRLALLFAALLLPALASAATVNGLTVTAQGGQLWITFDKNSISGPFTVYRYTSAISSGNVGSATTITSALSADSWKFPYDDSCMQCANLQAGMVTEDYGTPLTSADALLVWTPPSSGNWCIAVTHGGDSTLTSGVNSLSSCVSITAVADADLGAIIVSDFVPTGGYTTYRALQCANFDTYDHTNWPFYCYRFNVFMSDTSTTPRAVFTELHGATGMGYSDPSDLATLYSATGQGVYIIPRDLNFTGNNQEWFGGPPVGGAIQNQLEQHLHRMITWVQGKSTFAADPTRNYIYGGSMGGMGSLHMAVRYPTFFAWAGPRFGAFNYFQVDATIGLGTTWRDALVNGTATTFEDFYDVIAAAAGPFAMPPMFYCWGTDDGAFGGPDDILLYSAQFLAVMNTARHSLVASWGPHGHGCPSDVPTSTADRHSPWRFQTDEAYMAFSNGSDAQVYDDEDQMDDRLVNRFFDWGSEYHELSGESIVDMTTTFEVPLLYATTGSATADVTIRNAQSFQPMPGTAVAWTHKAGVDGAGSVLDSGMVMVDADGLVTIEDLAISDSGSRLLLTIDEEEPPAPIRHRYRWNRVN